MTSKSRRIRGREIGASEAISEHCVRVQRLKPVPRSHRSAVYELAATRRSNRRGRTESRTDAGRAAGSLANAMAALMMCGSPTDKTAHKVYPDKTA